MAKDRKRLFSDYVRMRIGNRPSENSKTHMSENDETVVDRAQSNQGDFISYSYNQLAQLRALASDRKGQYDSFDEISQDSTIAAALELYADDATQSDEQGRVIWVESDNPVIAKAANRLLDIMEIPERAWKHIYMACKYGDFYLKLYRKQPDTDENLKSSIRSVKVVNDSKKKVKEPNPYQTYIEDVNDPAPIFDLRVKGKTAGYVVIPQDLTDKSSNIFSSAISVASGDIKIYPPDRYVHIMISDNPSRLTEELSLQFSDNETVTYQVARGKSTLADVYGIQKQLSLLEDTLALTRLVKSPLIRLLEIEVGDMPKNEVNPYLRRFKQLIEQHISLDKNSGDYNSYSAPGPIDNLILVPVKNGKGASNVNTLGGDVNVRDIADIEYYSNKRAGALKIPRSYLGDSSEGSAFDNGGTLTRLSIRYARTIKRIQRAYIRAITQLLNLFFLDMNLDYIGKFEVRMTSPSTQEDLERNELVGNNVELISSFMDLTSSLEGSTQKKILTHFVSNVLKMPEVSELITQDSTPEEEIDIEGTGGFTPSKSLSSTKSNSPGTVDASSIFGGDSSSDNGTSDTAFTDSEYNSFQDTI